MKYMLIKLDRSNNIIYYSHGGWWALNYEDAKEFKYKFSAWLYNKIYFTRGYVTEKKPDEEIIIRF